MINDVSGNDEFVDQEDYPGNEVSEQDNYTTYDYTPYFQSIENHLSFTNASLIAFIILFGLLKGFKKI